MHHAMIKSHIRSNEGQLKAFKKRGLMMVYSKRKQFA